jgi:hypothetical protein
MDSTIINKKELISKNIFEIIHIMQEDIDKYASSKKTSANSIIAAIFFDYIRDKKTITDNIIFSDYILTKTKKSEFIVGAKNHFFKYLYPITTYNSGESIENNKYILQNIEDVVLSENNKLINILRTNTYPNSKGITHLVYVALENGVSIDTIGKKILNLTQKKYPNNYARYRVYNDLSAALSSVITSNNM